MTTQIYQKAYYLSHPKLKERHRLYQRALRSGQIKPKHHTLSYKKEICRVCSDTIFGPRRRVYFYGWGNGVLIDDGCFLLLSERGIIDNDKTELIS